MILDRPGALHSVLVAYDGWRPRNELLNGEILYTLKEAQVVVVHWRRHYNTRQPHSAPGYRPPAPEVVLTSEIKGVMETRQLAA